MTLLAETSGHNTLSFLMTSPHELSKLIASQPTDDNSKRRQFATCDRAVTRSDVRTAGEGLYTEKKQVTVKLVLHVVCVCFEINFKDSRKF